MSSILYYSNYCNHSKKILGYLSKTKLKDQIHFICIDKREIKNGECNIILENGQSVILPKKVTKVPALLLLNETYMIYFGDDILEFFKPKEEVIVSQSTNNNMEPNAYSISDNSSVGSYGVHSDNYSYLDMSVDDLSAKGSGGIRQMYNYSDINGDMSIQTPDEDYKPDKVDEHALSEYEKSRN